MSGRNAKLTNRFARKRKLEPKAVRSAYRDVPGPERAGWRRTMARGTPLPMTVDEYQMALAGFAKQVGASR